MYGQSAEFAKKKGKPIIMSDDYYIITGWVIQGKKAIIMSNLLEKVNNVLDIVQMYFACKIFLSF